MGVIWSVRSQNVKPLNAVWLDSTAVGITAHSMPSAEMIGKATVRLQRPTQEMS